MAKIKFNIDYSKSKGASKEEMDKVAAWQQRRGLTVDGVWGKNTQAAYEKEQSVKPSNNSKINIKPNERSLTDTTRNQIVTPNKVLQKEELKKTPSEFEKVRKVGSAVKIGNSNLQATVSAKGVADELGLEFVKHPINKSKEVVNSIVNTPWSKLGIVAGSAAAGSIVEKTKLPFAKYVGLALKNIPTAVNTYENVSKDYKDDGKINWGNQTAEVIKNVAAGQVGSFSGKAAKKTVGKIGKTLKEDFNAGNPLKLNVKQNLKEAVKETYDNTLIKKASDKIKLVVRDTKFRYSDQSIKSPTLTPLTKKEKLFQLGQQDRREKYKVKIAERKQRELSAKELKEQGIIENQKKKITFKNNKEQPQPQKQEPRKFSDASTTPRKKQLRLSDGGESQLTNKQRTKIKLASENAQRQFNKLNNISEDPYSYRSNNNRGLLLPQSASPVWLKKLIQQTKIK